MANRDYEHWDVNPGQHDKLQKGTDGALYNGVAEGNNPRDVINQVGKQALIERMAGTTDKKSRAYKSARDQVQRWNKGSRKPSKANQGRLRAIAEEARRSAVSALGKMFVKIAATFRFSSGTWDYVQADLTGDALSDYLAAVERGDYEMATQIVAEEYGIDPGDIEGFDDFGGVEMDW